MTTPDSPSSHRAAALSSAPLSRRTLLGGTGALAAAATSPLLWVPPASAATRAAGVHLMYGRNPQHQMALSWSTAASVKRPRVEIGMDKSYGLTLRPDSRGTKDIGSVYHHVDVDHLRQGTRYFYRISHAGSPPVTGSFRTAPKKQRPFRFATFGDMGVNAAAAAHVALINKMRPKFAFVVGDLCYADSSGGLGVGGPDTQDFAVWDQWLGQIQSSAARVPWMTTVGNHEMEEGNGELGYQGYLDRFNLPGNGVKGAPVTYSYTYSNVGFIALDGNDASYEISRNKDYLGSAQDRWLVNKLARFRRDPDIDFIVVGFHNCMYCTNLVHGSDGGHRDRWEPLFDQFSVDLVVNGHNHCYERTHPVRGGLAVKEAPIGSTIDSKAGTTYLTAGGAGQAVYPTGGQPLSYVTIEGGVRVPETTDWSSVTDERHSIAFVDVKPRNKNGVATMKIVGLGTDGSVIDRVKLKRRN